MQNTKYKILCEYSKLNFGGGGDNFVHCTGLKTSLNIKILQNKKF